MQVVVVVREKEMGTNQVHKQAVRRWNSGDHQNEKHAHQKSDVCTMATVSMIGEHRFQSARSVGC